MAKEEKVLPNTAPVGYAAVIGEGMGAKIIPPEYYEGIMNQTVAHQLQGLESAVDLMMPIQMEKLSGYQKALAKDLTKTKGHKIVLFGKKIDEVTAEIIGQIVTETKTASEFNLGAEKKVGAALSFNTNDELLIAARWLSVIDTPSEFEHLATTEFEVARLALKDPVTRRKFGVDPSMEERILLFVKNTILGPKATEQYDKYARKMVILEDYMGKLLGVNENIIQISNAISATEVK